MSRFNYSSALGDNSSPFAPIKHHIEPATAIGIGVGAASLIGSGINAYSNLKNQANTNETNYKIWQEQLAAQKENWKREQDNYLQNRRWQLEDIANERNYNSPAAQKARYLAAGINPYLANSFGQAQAVSPPPSAPNFSSPVSPSPMQSTSVDFGIGQGVSAAAQAYYSAKNEQRSDYALGSDITFRDRSTKAELMNAAAKAKEVGVNEKWIDSQIRDAERNYYFNQDRFARENEWQNMQHNIEQQRVNIEQFRADTERMATQSGIELNYASISELYYQRQKLQEEVIQMRKKGADDSKIAKFVARQQKATAEKLERENERGKRNNLPGVRQKYQDFTEWLFTPIKGLISIGGKF